MGKINEFYRAYSTAKFYVTMDGAYMGDGTARDFVAFERPTCILGAEETPIESSTNRITLEELLDDFKDMSLAGFRREYCLHWMDSIGEVFSQKLIDRIVRWDDMPEDVSSAKVVMGLDLGKKRNKSVLTIGELTGEGVKVINVIEWPLETQYHNIAAEIVDLRVDYPNAQMLVVDETGVGKGVIEIFQKQIEKNWKVLDLVGFDFAGPKKKIDLVEAAITELEQGRSNIVYNRDLVDEMLDYKREITVQGNIKYVKSAGGSDDFVDSLLLCLYAGRDYYGYDEGGNDIETTGFSILARGASKFARVPI